ncbi:MAG: FliH/SctL family protein [SAR324 cluster bacterium]|jgi:flagellar assembly protein FliH|nr:FliH/SctL family protein [SAR324 cluster bacterium]
MDSPEFKPFELKDFDSGESIQESAVSEADGFKPLNYNESEDYAALGEADEKSETEKIELSENFHTDDFLREDSLLTNAEDYARNIREGAALYKQQLVSENEAALKETERIKQETLALRKSGEEEKLKMLEEARAEVQSIRDEAFKEGYDKGIQEGMEKRYREAAPIIERVEEVLRQLESLRQVVRFQGEQELVQMALLVAKRVVLEEIRSQPDVIETLLKTALKEIESKGKIRVLLHPDDHEFLVQSGLDLDPYLKEEQNLLIKNDPEASPGSIHMESDEEVINFDFKKRFEEVEELLSNELAERHARLDEVDMDTFDYSGASTQTSEDAASPESESPDQSAEEVQPSENASAVDSPSLNDETELDESDADEKTASKEGDAEAAAEDETEDNVPA